MNLSCGVANQVSLGLGRRAECEARAGGGNGRPSAASTGVVGSCEREGKREGKKERSVRWAGTRFLYPAKAAAGQCARLARCGGRGFLMRACRLVYYLFRDDPF
jgi:hypothetical protein